ncbi:MAG TPA: C39 family peptidase [Candidatus Dormibacteraeota bacterium]
MRNLALVILFVACGGTAPAPSGPAPLAQMAFVAQTHHLSCEAAALQMALTHAGITRTQDQLLDLIGLDRQAPELDAGGAVVHWGDPYEKFVGDPDGSEIELTGYGVYAPAVGRAAQGLGAQVLVAGEGVAPAQVYDYVAQQHPVIAWVSMSGHGDYAPKPTTTYVAFDGRQVVFGAGFEHSVVVVGATPDSVQVLDPEPDVGPHTLSRADFEASYQVFGQMAVALR